MPWHHPKESRGSVGVLVVGGIVVLVGTVGAGGGVVDHELFGVARGVAEADEMGQVRAARSGSARRQASLLNSASNAARTSLHRVKAGHRAPQHRRTGVPRLGDPFRLWACNRYLGRGLSSRNDRDDASERTVLRCLTRARCRRWINRCGPRNSMTYSGMRPPRCGGSTPSGRAWCCTRNRGSRPGRPDLSVRETQCCSFFEFTLSATGDELTMDITAPAGQVDVLDAFVDRARIAAGLMAR
jgi:hypothetical protein